MACTLATKSLELFAKNPVDRIGTAASDCDEEAGRPDQQHIFVAAAAWSFEPRPSGVTSKVIAHRQEPDPFLRCVCYAMAERTFMTSRRCHSSINWSHRT
jgi:hypothetical protein